ncbi:hypothetical protein ACWDTQ_32625 [Streptomyces cellulosae]
MTAPTTLVDTRDPLTRLRERALRLTYLSTHPVTITASYVVARLLDELTEKDPEAARKTADGLNGTRYFEMDDYALDKATALGFDTSDWPDRRRQINAMTEWNSALHVHDGTPAAKARQHWHALVENHGPIAAHLANHLRNLHPDWLDDIFNATQLEDVKGPLHDDTPPEAAAPGAGDDCDACAEVSNHNGKTCRFHTGWDESQDHTLRLLQLATQHPEGRRIITERAAEMRLELDETAALGEVFGDDVVQEKLEELLDRVRAGRDTEETA